MIITPTKLKIFQALKVRSQRDLAHRLGLQSPAKDVIISQVLSGARVNKKLREKIARLARKPVTYFWPRSRAS